MDNKNSYFNMFTLMGRLQSYYFDSENNRHVIMLKTTNQYGDYVTPINTFGKLNDKILSVLKEDTMIAIKGFTGLDKDGHPELNAEKLSFLSRSDDDDE